MRGWKGARCHRHPDAGEDPGTELLLRRQDAARAASCGGGYPLLPVAPAALRKSLLVDTLKELFEGNAELFRGLAIHGQWDWAVKHPVVRFDFSGGEFGDPDGIREEVSDQLETMAAQAGVEVGRARPAILFRRLVRALRGQAGRPVVVLVDEYDKPILDALPVPEVARANREFLRASTAASRPAMRTSGSAS